MRELDLDAWPRRWHFDFFRPFHDPYFNLCAEVDVTELYDASRGEGRSFFAAALHASLVAANGVEEFRYRLRGERVVVHDVVHAGSTVLRDDETFGFGYFEFDSDFEPFARAVRTEIERVRAAPEITPAGDRDDLLYYSVIPWVRFTSFAHARDGDDGSVPRIVFGKIAREAGRTRMPVSVEVHHALMDGLHVGRFFDRFQRELARPRWRPVV